MKIGPNAQAIVDALEGRPAAVIGREENHVQHTFRALFTGAQSPGTLTDIGGRPFFGKDEAEWHWPDDWDRLAALGLITYRTEIQQSPAARSGQRTLIHWQITPKGWNVRTDDLAWWAEFRAAREQDEATRQ